MFRTIFSVTLYKSESTEFRAYFDDSAAAKKYAENLTKKTADEYVFVSQKDIDGSFILIWQGNLTTITLDDNAWIPITKQTASAFTITKVFQRHSRVTMRSMNSSFIHKRNTIHNSKVFSVISGAFVEKRACLLLFHF